jgi:hypothetical protein
MGAKGKVARPAGTGSIFHRAGRWKAYLPAPRGGATPKMLGSFDFYHQAERALDTWLTEQKQRKAG